MIDPSSRVPLGATSVTATRLALGTAPIGKIFDAGSEERSQASLRRAFELGVRFFDTAPLYGFGLAEERLGRFLRTVPRDDVVVATKVGRLLRADAPPDPRRATDPATWAGAPALNWVFDFSYDGVMRSLEESLARLGTDRVDVLHIHDPDDHEEQALSGAFKALRKLREEGTIGAVGSGMNQAAMLARFARAAEFNCFLLAGRYSLLDHETAVTSLLPICVERNVSIIIGGVYNSGILANPVAGAPFNYEPAPAPWLDRAQRIKAVCDRHGVPLMAAAIQFPLAHPAVATVLSGVRTPAEIEENHQMMQFPIPAGLWTDLRSAGLIHPEAPTP
ncbi:MAG: aldo/keto reductase [Chloroflexota bacterium]